MKKQCKYGEKNHSKSKLLIVVCIILLILVSNIKLTNCYLISKASITNTFGIAQQYSVKFNANGGMGEMPDQKIIVDKDENLKLNTFTKEGFWFDGWNTAEDGTGFAYEDGESVKNLTNANSSITLYAQWSLDNYVAEMDGIKYTSVKAALDIVPNNVEKTIKLLRNIESTEAITIVQNKIVIFNLQNHTISNSNDANIKIIDNNGTLEIINGTIQSSAGYGAVDNNATGRLTVNGVKIIATGTRQAIYNLKGIVDIKGDSYLCSSALERATVQNAKPSNGVAGTINILGGTIISTRSTQKGAVENEETGTINILGGIIKSNNNMGVNNKGTLIIGTNDEDIDCTTPIIQGKTFGVSTTENGTLEVYDGIIKGITSAFNNEDYIDAIESKSEIEHDTEEIEGQIYDTAFLNTQLKVTFDATGGIVDENTRYILMGSEIGTLPIPTRAHYSFVGWFTSEEEGEQITSSTIINKKATYYAHWNLIEAVVTFDANGGTAEEDTRIVSCGTQLGNLPTATKQYKTFAGWYTEATGGEEITSTQIINNDITYYAHWNSKNITVTFDANPGTVIEETRTFIEGEPIGTLPIPVNGDYLFAGWYTDEQYTTKINENSTAENDTTYYAKWIDKMSTVFAIENPVTFNGKNTPITEGEVPEQYIGKDGKYIDTHVALFSEENFDKDFEIGFTIDLYNPNGQDEIEENESTQFTFINTKDENGSSICKGLVFRVVNGSKNKYELVVSTTRSEVARFNSTDTVKVKIFREDKIIYYSINDGEKIEIQEDYQTFKERFNTTATFGASVKSNGTVFRHLNATLSNLYIKLENVVE